MSALGRSVGELIGPRFEREPLGTAGLALLGSLAAAIFVVVLGPVLALLVVVGAIAAIAALAMPGLLLGAYLLIPFYKGAIQPYLPVDLTVMLAAANMLQVIPLVLRPRPLAFGRPAMLMWIGIGTLVLAGTLYAADQSLALRTATMFWVLVIAPLSVAAIRVASDPRLVRQLVWSFFAMGVITVALGLTQLSGADRLVLLGMNTIQVSLAALLVPLIGVPFVLVEGRPAMRLLTFSLIPVAFIVAIAAGSRGPILTLLLLAVLAGLRNLLAGHRITPRVLVTIVAAVAATIVAFVLASAVLPAASLERFSLLGTFASSLLAGDPSSGGGDTSSEARARLLATATQMFMDHPLLGAGTSGFESLSPTYLGPFLADAYPHNSVLQFAAEFGIVGLAMFLGFVAIALMRRIPDTSEWTAVKAAAIYFLLNSLLSGDILQDRMTWGFLLLLVVARTTRATGGAGVPLGEVPTAITPAVELAGSGQSGRARARAW